MPIFKLSGELVQQIIDSYGQIRKLNLSTNAISRVENLERLSCLTKLNLSANRLGQAPESLFGLSRLTCLRELDLSDNGITMLEPLSVASGSLEKLNLANNIIQRDQVVFLSSLTALTELVLAGNPISREDGYRRRVFELCPSLEALDHTPGAQDKTPFNASHDPQTSDAAEAGISTERIPESPPPKGIEYLSSDSSDEAEQPLDHLHSDRGELILESEQLSIIGVRYQDGGGQGKSNESGNVAVSSARSEESAMSAALMAGGEKVDVETPLSRVVAFSSVHVGAEQQFFSARSPQEHANQEAAQLFPASASEVGKNRALDSAPVAKVGGVVASPQRCQTPPARDLSAGIVKTDGEARFDSTAIEVSLGQGRVAAITKPMRQVAAVMSSAMLHENLNCDGSGSVDCKPASGEKTFPHGQEAGRPGALADWTPLTGAGTLMPAGDEDPFRGIGSSPAPIPTVTATGVQVRKTAGNVVKVASGMVQNVSQQLEYPVSSIGSHTMTVSEQSTTDRRAAATTPNQSVLARMTLSGSSSSDRLEETMGIPSESFRHTPTADTQLREDTIHQSCVKSSDALRYSFEAHLSPVHSRVATPSQLVVNRGRDTAFVLDRRSHATPVVGEHPRDDGEQGVAAEGGPYLVSDRDNGDARRTTELGIDDLTAAGRISETRRRVDGTAAPEEHVVEDQFAAGVFGTAGPGYPYGASRNPSGHILRQPPPPPPLPPLPLRKPQQQQQQHHNSHHHDQQRHSVSVGTRSDINETPEKEGVRQARQSLPCEWGAAQAPSSTAVQARHAREVRTGGVVVETELARVGRALGDGVLGGGGVPRLPVADEWEKDAFKRENEALRRQADLAEKRCSALVEMQHLADKALAKEHAARCPSAGARCTAGNVSSGEPPVLGENDVGSQEDGEYTETRERDVFADLLGLWRSEVLKLLLQRRHSEEVAAEECRKAARRLQEEREARARADANSEALTQRALAAEAEADLLRIKLERALQDARENKEGRRAAEASCSGHAMAVAQLNGWVRDFVGRASEGLYEREALLARGVAKLEAFSQRVGLAAGRLEVVQTLLQRKEVQLRNSRAALAADRRVWLLERRQQELAILAKTAPPRPSSDSQPPPEQPLSRQELHPTSQPIMLEGLRPECEAVMRALFCRVDRLGTGAVSARRLLDVLRSDCGVTELMEAAVGAFRWRAALDTMESRLCPSTASRSSGGAAGGWFDADTAPPLAPAAADSQDADADECNITWGEFLLFFLPTAGPADDAYNAGLVNPGRRGDHAKFGGGESCDRKTSMNSWTATEDSIAMLQMVIPRNWTAVDPSGPRSNAIATAAATGAEIAKVRGLEALSVGQLRREVRRLAKERVFLLGILREDSRLGARRAVAVHDQYRHELRELQARIGEVERSLEEAARRADEEQNRAEVAEEKMSGLRERMQQAEHDWRRKLDVAAQEQSAAVEASSREASKAAIAARERLSRVEAEHALALRENGKASVRQRALERELARVKDSLETEARLEKDALEERLRAGESKLAIARRERNALLAALRDMQRSGTQGMGGLRPRSPISTGTSPSATSSTGRRWGGVFPAADTRETSVSDHRMEKNATVFGDENSDGGMEYLKVRAGDHGSNLVSGDATSSGGGGDGSGTDGGDNGATDGGDDGARTQEWDPRDKEHEGAGGITGADGVGVGVGMGDGAAEKSASLAARLEMLAVQTRKLLAEDSSSCSSYDSEPE